MTNNKVFETSIICPNCNTKIKIKNHTLPIYKTCSSCKEKIKLNINNIGFRVARLMTND